MAAERYPRTLSGVNEAINAAINAAAQPTDIEVLQARRAILDRLSNGEVTATRTLVSSLAHQQGVRSPAQREKLQLPNRTPTSDDVRDEPLVIRVRLQIAGMWALAELAARGNVIACETPTGASVSNLTSPLSLAWTTGSTSAGTHITLPLPKLAASHYQIAHHLRSGEPWYTDPDLFTADLKDLHLDPRTHRCIVEALDCWRRGLFLATANMLAAAFEGAWMSAAVRLRDVSPSVAKAIQTDQPRVANVQKHVAGYLESRGMRLQAGDLRSHAALLRELRNYGIHTKPSVDDRLERYLDEATSGLLILTTHRHLVALTEATCRALEES